MIRLILILLATFTGLVIGAFAGLLAALLAANLYNCATNSSPDEAGLLLVLASVALPVGGLLGATLGVVIARRRCPE